VRLPRSAARRGQAALAALLVGGCGAGAAAAPAQPGRFPADPDGRLV